MRKLIKTSCFLILMPFLLTACKKDEDVEDCDCAGSTFGIIENTPASYSANGVFLVKDPRIGMVSYYDCDRSRQWEVSKTDTTFNYTISGNLKRKCLGPNPELIITAPGGPIELTDVKKND